MVTIEATCVENRANAVIVFSTCVENRANCSDCLFQSCFVSAEYVAGDLSKVGFVVIFIHRSQSLCAQ